MNAFFIVNLLGSLLIISSFLVIRAKTPRKAAFIYSAQSLILVSCFVALGFATGSDALFLWAGTGFVTKVVLLPAIILYALKKIGPQEEDGLAPTLNTTALVMLIAIEVFVCVFLVQGIELPTAVEVKPALGISLAHFFVGLTCIVTQRNIFKQVFGYCLMENGSHLTLALLAPTAPHLVEIGITTDAIFAVLIMAIMAVRIFRMFGSLDADELMELKG